MKAKTWKFVWPVLLALAIVGYGALLWKGPWWFDGDHLRERNLQPADGVVITGFRTVLVAVGVGVTAIIGLIYTHRSHQHALNLFEHTRDKDRETAELTREGQVTGRYVDAIKLLATQDMREEGRKLTRLTERLGGIYALERIMHDSEKDHETVVQVLAAFVRQNAPLPDPDLPDPGEAPPAVPDDVQAALTVLGRRPKRMESQNLDLAFTALWHADLSGADFSHANFFGSDMRYVNLTGARLKGALLGGADLEHAMLKDADLRGAELVGSPYRVGAKLTADQLLEARFDEATELPDVLRNHPAVKLRA
ncbi:pentapeptide repeat-containing protein [Streptomyces sp. NBC_01637]|uniref:pentapeptide repeat-containing protein n=1 Tax=unclassified Streptomyces TaxID=2593676 RepID=UPI003865965D|nr:pentapeptide repeat-containing protein [Streptomyces sp. NBC_01653]WTD91244.1 pentapeptide repeat-containing protein [Streptomyces sp. NBC_01637]